MRAISTPTTLVDILQQRSISQPQQSVFRFLVDGETDAVELTFGELHQTAQAIAAQLQASNLTGQRALLLYPPGLDFIKAFLGCLYAGVIAIPAYPPRRNRPSPWLEAIAKDAQPTAVLSDTVVRTNVLHHPVLALQETVWLTTDQVDLAAHYQPSTPVSPDAVAFLQYTSGSTANPKGVMVTHCNLEHNLAVIQQSCGLSETSRGVTWLPPYHDMGLANFLGPIVIGMSMTFMSPMSFLEKPIRWLQAISREKATVSGGPNFAFDLCVDKIPVNDRNALDLSHWALAFVGAEPVRQETLERFITAFEPYGFRKTALYPCYGLAEATLMVSGGKIDDVPITHQVDPIALQRNEIIKTNSGGTLISCGHSWLDQQIIIVDPHSLTTCDHGQVGEIWVSGPSVAQGYWNRPQATEETFQAYLADSGAGPYLRTGDLGFLQDGELYITGRLKDLIIIRGRNFYPQDIESVAHESHPALQPNNGVAFSVDVDGQEQLAIAFEVKRQNRNANIDAVSTAIRANIAQKYDIEVYAVVLIKPGHLPKTTSGKVKRSACRAAFLQETLPIIGQSIQQTEVQPQPLFINDAETSIETYLQSDQPTSIIHSKQSDIEADLRVILAEYLRVLPTQVDLGQPIHQLGLGSLAAIALKSHIEDTYNLELPMEIFFEDVTVRELIAEYILHESPDEIVTSPLVDPAEVKSIITPKCADIAAHSEPLQPRAGDEKMQFSLLFFSANAAEFSENKYQLVLEAGKFADDHDFEAIWLPERHFHPFGGLYPDPSLLATALAMITKRIRLRAGSVVLPLHHPVRVAEAWAVVDNLSKGRVDLAFATGWNPNDFILSPQHFEARVQVTYDNIKTIQQLWQGQTVSFTNGVGQPSAIRVHPLPQQPQLTTWLTCSGGSQRFVDAGRLGHNVLTALLFQSPSELAEKITLYRQARADHGYDPQTGKVTLMLHTYIGEDHDTVRAVVQAPFTRYLESSTDLWQPDDRPLDELSDKERQDVLMYAFERYYQRSALIGTQQSCMSMVQELHAVGVNEIACLIDFGVDLDKTLAGLQALDALKEVASR